MQHKTNKHESEKNLIIFFSIFFLFKCFIILGSWQKAWKYRNIATSSRGIFSVRIKNKTKQNKTKQNKTKQNKIQNKTKQNKTKQNKTKQKQTQNKTKQNKTKQNKTNKQKKKNQSNNFFKHFHLHSESIVVVKKPDYIIIPTYIMPPEKHHTNTFRNQVRSQLEMCSKKFGYKVKSEKIWNMI